MAEFREVMEQLKRMCSSYGTRCTGCVIGNVDECCLYIKAPNSWGDADIKDVEAKVMKWAAEHPEPKYPSWHEAWRQLFPDGQGSPCPSYYNMKHEPEWCGSDDCKRCKNRPIPADIAEKLGIKPIGGSNDA